MKGKHWALLGAVACPPAVVLVVLLMAASVFAVAGGAPTAAAPSSVPGISPVLLRAYVQAAATTSRVAPACTGMRWSVLAGIAQIESGQAQGRTIAGDGTITPPILGPRLDGSGAGGNTTAFPDTDDGRWDGDTAYDRAVGPFQFIPTSWVAYGRDGNGDGTADPHNAFDAALGAVVHLCGSATRDLRDPAQLADALYGYNRSTTYVQEVTSWIARFDQMGAGAPPPASGRGGQIVAAATRWLGVPYSWGGGTAEGPSEGFGRGAGTVGFDCSGLTLNAYAAVGILLPRVSKDQFNAGPRIPRSAGVAALAPGDLVFYAANPSTGAGVYHVGIYVGGGQMINAPRTGTVVRIEPLWMDSYAGAVRFP